jgi:PAS domain S-box-containing protein
VESERDTAIRNHEQFDLEYRIVRPSGEVRWLSGRGRGHYDETGNVVRVVGNNIDVTERVQAKEAMRESKERETFLLRLTDTLRPLSDPVAIQEVTARLLAEHLHVNRVEYADIDGKDYIMRLSHANGVAPIAGRGPVATFGEWLLESYKSGEPNVVNDVQTDPRFTESERANLQEADIAAFASVMLVKDNRLVAAFAVNTATPRVWTKPEVEVIRNVAERVWEAVERARAEEALRRREQRLRIALDASRGGSWTWDARTGGVDWDDRFRELYGFAAGEPSSCVDAWAGRVHEEDRPRVLGLLDEVVRTPALNGWENTFRIVRPDGTVAWIESRGQADRDADGHLVRITGLDLDVTERRRAEEVLQARRDEERERTLQRQAEEALRRSHAELEQRTLQLRRLASQLTLAERTQTACQHTP